MVMRRIDKISFDNGYIDILVKKEREDGEWRKDLESDLYYGGDQFDRDMDSLKDLFVERLQAGLSPINVDVLSFIFDYPKKDAPGLSIEVNVTFGRYMDPIKMKLGKVKLSGDGGEKMYTTSEENELIDKVKQGAFKMHQSIKDKKESES